MRERKEDILPLAEHFLKKYSQQMKRDVKGLTPEAVRRLMLHDWPGNVRELENTIEYAVAMTQKDMVTRITSFRASNRRWNGLAGCPRNALG